MRFLIAIAMGCAGSPEQAPAPPPGPCDIASAPHDGPLAAERAGATDMLALAQLEIREARLTGDPGHYSLGEQAVACAALTRGDDPEVRWLNGFLLVQFHEFSQAEALAAQLVADRDGWQDHMLLGDARMERGDIDGARVAYQDAMNRRPGPLLYDRLSWLAWWSGSADDALYWQRTARGATSPGDAETFAWMLTQLGWLHALTGQPAPEIQHAIQVLPGFPEAHLRRGMLRLHAGDAAGAAADFRKAGDTVEAVRALAEVDPTADVHRVGGQDPRGYAMWLADRDPDRALALLRGELEAREDATTLMAVAYATHRAGGDGAPWARRALAHDPLEPRVLLLGALVLNDPALLARAKAMPAGLLPSELAMELP